MIRKNDVNLDRSLIVKGCRADGRLHMVSYRTVISEHYQVIGQELCQSVRIKGYREGGSRAGFG